MEKFKFRRKFNQFELVSNGGQKIIIDRDSKSEKLVQQILGAFEIVERLSKVKYKPNKKRVGGMRNVEYYAPEFSSGQKQEISTLIEKAKNL